MTYTATPHGPAYAIDDDGEISFTFATEAQAREFADELNAAESLRRLGEACGVEEVEVGIEA